MYSFADDRHVQSIPRAYFLDLEHYSRARLALHPVAAFLGFEPLCRHAVDLQYLISAPEAVLVCRRTEIRLVDDDILLLLLMDDGSDASICLGQHHLQVFVFFLRDIDGIWVQLLQHGIDPFSHHLVHRKRIHIRPAELLYYTVVDFRPLSQLEIPGLSHS